MSLTSQTRLPWYKVHLLTGAAATTLTGPVKPAHALHAPRELSDAGRSRCTLAYFLNNHAW